MRLVQGRAHHKGDAEHRDHLSDGGGKTLHLDAVERRTAYGPVYLFKARLFKGVAPRHFHDTLRLVGFLNA